MELYSSGHYCPFLCIQRHTIIPVTDVHHYTTGTIICTPHNTIPKPSQIRSCTSPSFSNYINTLPPWEHTLIITNKELHYCVLNLTTNITLDNTLWLNTDGKAKTQYDSFGWILANDSICLWESNS
eukprot:5945904-Ditylum_brightwellii.AAC.1